MHTHTDEEQGPLLLLCTDTMQKVLVGVITVVLGWLD